MHYKTKSALTIAILIGFMVSVAVVINNLEGQITGAVIAPVCECFDDVDCDDSNPATQDSCLYADNCEAAVCVHK